MLSATTVGAAGRLGVAVRVVDEADQPPPDEGDPRYGPYDAT